MKSQNKTNQANLPNFFMPLASGWQLCEK